MSPNPWWTEGYRLLASAWLHLASKNDFLTKEDRDFTFAIIREAGQQIRREHING